MDERELEDARNSLLAWDEGMTRFAESIVWFQNIEHNDVPMSSKSGTGFVIFVGNFPVLWQSKLQVETAMSTTELEVVALSQSMRELLWLRG